MTITLTWGAELEWSDYSRETPLPGRNVYDRQDVTIVNTNGVAADPLDVITSVGGEINTEPTDSIDEQVENFILLRNLLRPTVNYRSNQHIHVGLPRALRDDLDWLKAFWSHVVSYHKTFMSAVDLIPSWRDLGVAAQQRSNHSLRSHQREVPLARFHHMMSASTMAEFKDRIAPPSRVSGKPCWQLYARWGINPKPLWEHGTIEFRCFWGTLDEVVFERYLMAVRDFVELCARGAEGCEAGRLETSFFALCKRYSGVSFPPSRYDQFLEWGWTQTSRARVSEGEAIVNARRIERGERWT